MRILLPIVLVAAIISLAFCANGNVNASASDSVVYDDSGSRTLILLRHAKSDKSNMNMPDIERPLEASGREEAEEMGKLLKEKKISVDLIVSSPSVRTKQTLEIICPLIGYDYSKIQWDSSLYACTGEHLENTIKKTDNKYKTVMYVGHNPSITAAANYFQSELTIDEVKTCGVVNVEFYTNDWANVAAGELLFYAKPK